MEGGGPCFPAPPLDAAGGWAWPTMNNRKVKVSVVAKFLTKVDLDDKTTCIRSAWKYENCKRSEKHGKRREMVGKKQYER
jgi:hypothetical protein